MYHSNQYDNNYVNRFFRFVWKWVKRALILAVIIGVVIGIAKTYQTMYPKTVYKEVQVDVSDKKFAEKIDSLEKSVVEAVHSCERQNYKESDGLVMYDPTTAQHEKNMKKFNAGTRAIVDTGELSFGTYAFKKSTVIYYYKTLYKQDITGKEAILIALDDNKAGQLTQDILFKTKDGYTNWINCSTKLSLVDMIQAIKKIK